jgi:hypothetical protein
MLLMIPLALILVPGYTVSRVPPPSLEAPKADPAAIVVPEAAPSVWLVDKQGDIETYSNGLRIENRYAVSGRARGPYPAWARSDVNPANPEWREQPAGLVYHTTESDLAPLEPEQNRALQRIGHEVLTFIARRRAYHFVIDRFGRVFRIVAESDVAYHAGNSIWADDRRVYVNLNHSFLGVAFETRTEARAATPAQVLSARVLTQMLRGKYRIAAADCVTHAQVSVNPSNRLIGWHTDWAGNFPFLELGLGDNYGQPPAAMYAFGFGYDPSFVESTGARVWQGLIYAQEQVRRDAAARHLSVAQYKEALHKKYREIILKEKPDEI